MWHELVLAGVGGRTIAEAKARISYDEALRWFDYLQRNGTVSLGARIEKGFAMLATVINNAHGGKAKMRDFMLFSQQEDDEMTIESAFLVLKAASKKEG